MKAWVSIVVVVLLLIGGGVLLSRRSPAPSAPGSAGQRVGAAPSPAEIALPPLPADLPAAPALTRPRLQPAGALGEAVDLATFRGQKAVVVNFWASWCPPCQRELPDFERVSEEFPDDVAVLLVNRGEPLDTQVPYLRSVAGRNLLASPRLTFLDDPDDSAYEAFGGYGMPVTVFVTKAGGVASVKSGLLTLEEMRARVRQTLAVR